MIGREAEMARVEALLADARGGRSGALLITGEPGIGKTLILDRAGAGAGATVLVARGAEAEMRLAFAGLGDLLAPLGAHVADVPGPAGAALRGALGLGPPAPADRFTVYAAVLDVLARAAERAPVICLVDDAHWLDGESLEALAFVARRVEAEGIAIVLAARPGVRAEIDGSPIARLSLGGLHPSDAAELVRARARTPPDEATTRRLVAGAAGNPLALIELASELSPGQLTGTEPLPDPLPVGPHLADGLLRGLAGAGPATRLALLVTSADDSAGRLLSHALAEAGLDLADLGPARIAGLIEGPDDAPRFRHPLIRAAVYASASPPDLRAAHRAHAVAYGAAGDLTAADRRAWHLALASRGPDAAVADELEQAAGRAAARSAHLAASHALRAAARLSTVEAERLRRLTAAGHLALSGGNYREGAADFDEVITSSPEPPIDAMVGRGFAETFAGSARRASEILETAAGRLVDVAPAGAGALLLHATIPAVMQSNMGRAMDLVGRAESLGAGAPPEVAAQLDAALSVIWTMGGTPRECSTEAVDQLRRQAALGDPVGSLWLVAWIQTRTYQEHHAEMEAELDSLIAGARARSAPGALVLPLFTRAELRRRTGRLDEALADAHESVRLAEDMGQDVNAGITRWVLARISAVRGEADSCRRLVAEMTARSTAADAKGLVVYGRQALGLLALGQGAFDHAIDHFDYADRERHGGGRLHPGFDLYRSDHAEALVRAGRTEEAHDELGQLEEESAVAGATTSAAGAARCRGILAHDDFETHFARALALHDLTRTPYERARTLLALGEQRRRARRAAEARPPLAEAVAIFAAMRATPWENWARRELEAAGGGDPERRASPVADPTPQELQVALVVAAGATNREAATALLLSPKTVEYHLGRVYGKLGVRSRTELAARFAEERPG